MKKILSLFLASLFFAAEANFMEKVKSLSGTAKEFGIKTIDAAKKNKPKTLFITLQLAVGGHRIYMLAMPEKSLNPSTEDKSNFLSLGQNSPLGDKLVKLYSKAGGDAETIKNKNLRPIKYVQECFNNGIGGTLFILEILKRLTTKLLLKLNK